MAKIILRRGEPIETTNEEANRVISAKNSPDFKGMIHVGNRAFTKTEIIEVRFDSEEPEYQQWRERNLEYYVKRNELLALSPEERAKVSSWGHFSLFFWGLKNRTPKVETRPKVEHAAAEFYAENPNWSRPSVKVWEKMLGLNPGYKLQEGVLRILECVEGQELSEVTR